MRPIQNRHTGRQAHQQKLGDADRLVQLQEDGQRGERQAQHLHRTDRDCALPITERVNLTRANQRIAYHNRGVSAVHA